MAADQTSRVVETKAVSQEMALAHQKENLHLLAEVGFLAAARGDVVRAERIFNACRLLRPDRAFPFIGLAVAFMNAKRIDDAIRIFERAGSLSDRCERQQLDVWRGFALQLGGYHHASRRLLESVVRQASEDPDCIDKEALGMAKSLLGLGSPPA